VLGDLRCEVASRRELHHYAELMAACAIDLTKADNEGVVEQTQDLRLAKRSPTFGLGKPPQIYRLNDKQ